MCLLCAMRSIPALMLFRGGKNVARQSGAMAASDPAFWVQAHPEHGG